MGRVRITLLYPGLGGVKGGGVAEKESRSGGGGVLSGSKRKCVRSKEKKESLTRLKE